MKLHIYDPGQSLAYIYGRETKADADIAKVLTMDEARRIASNIAKLPKLAQSLSENFEEQCGWSHEARATYVK